MTAGASPLFDQCYEALTKQGSLKTWSLIVTIFGDLAPDGIAGLDSRFLGALCSTFAVRPEALRVALHRLRKDGWLAVEKRGRRSVYRLSDMGQKLTKEVYHRIYRPPVSQPSDWQILLTAETAPPPLGSISINSTVSVSASRSAEFGFTAKAKDVPMWLKKQLQEGEAAAEFAAFEAAIRDLPLHVAPLSQAQRLCVRLLVLHYWRRLLLRRSDVPEALMGPDWEGYNARIAARQIFDVFERPDEGVLAAGLFETV